MNTIAQRHAACCELVQDVACSAGEVRLKVVGASMLPAIWPGDLITVLRCNFAELQPGQIVLYCRDGKLTAHRIQHLAGDSLITRGDSIPSFDPPITSTEIVGHVAGISRADRAVNPEFTLWRRTFSSILRNSDLCMKATLFVSRRLLRTWNRPMVPMSASSLSSAKQ